MLHGMNCIVTIVEWPHDATAGKQKWENGKNIGRFLNRIAFREHSVKNQAFS